MSICYIGLGSNLGNREFFIRQAAEFIGRGPKIKLLKMSSLIETAPVGPVQPFFLNAAAKIETNLSPAALLDFLESIEKKLKKYKIEQDGPRTIDLDILLYDKISVNTPRLTIPHPRMAVRDFVLKPLLEIEPDIFKEFPFLRKSSYILIKK